MKRLIRTIAILCFIWLTGGCEKDTEPTWIAPKMEIQVVPQDDIKRKSAILKGNIGENDLEITECGFLYSINKTLLESKALGDKDVIKVLVEQTSGEVKVQLEELIPGTNYFTAFSSPAATPLSSVRKFCSLPQLPTMRPNWMQ